MVAGMLSLAFTLTAPVCGRAAWAAASPTSGGGVAEPRRFDIPSSALPSALDAYSAQTGLQVLYDGELAASRRSAAVHATLTPTEALNALLAGSGLVATYTREHDVVIVLDMAAGEAAFGPPPPADTVTPLGTIRVDPVLTVRKEERRWEDALYANLVQAELERAIRRNRKALSRAYQAKLRIWLDPAGIVRRSEINGSALDATLRRTIVGAIENLVISRPPPPDLPQPVSVRISVDWR